MQQKTLVNTDFLSKQYNGICLYSNFQLQQRLFDLDLIFGSDVHRSFDDFSDSFGFGDQVVIDIFVGSEWSIV